LEFVKSAWPVYGQHRALYDGFAMAFYTQLHADCAPVLHTLLQKSFLQVRCCSVASHSFTAPAEFTYRLLVA
jgi:midasin (ATPase involved in ribosome maturation)